MSALAMTKPMTQAERWREWLKRARPWQLPPYNPMWKEWWITSHGTGSGKTTAAAHYIAAMLDVPDFSAVLITKMVRERDHCMGILRDIADPDGLVKVSNRTLVMPSGAQVTGTTTENLATLRGGRFSLIWLDQLEPVGEVGHIVAHLAILGSRLIISGRGQST